MEETDIENRLKEIYYIVRVIDRDAQWIEDYYEFEPYEELLRSLRREVRLMQVENINNNAPEEFTLESKTIHSYCRFYLRSTNQTIYVNMNIEFVGTLTASKPQMSYQR